MQPPFAKYIASLSGALAGIEARISTGASTPDRAIDHAVAIIRYTVGGGGAVWLFGNGGSGTIADHIACDMVKMRKWRAFALTNPALTTTFANDHAYCHSFDAQLQVLARPGDVLIGMSCSGESDNVILAMGDSRMVHISLSGFKPDNRLRNGQADASFYVPSRSYGDVQIAHLAILHAMIELADGVP